MNLADAIPGYREAVEREKFEREIAFLDIPETAGGVQLMPLTLRRVIALNVAGSPFVCGGQPTPVNTALTLWALSPEYSPGARFARWRFIRRCRRINYLKTIRDLDEYFDSAFADSPGGRPVSGPSYYSFSAAVVDVFAHEYGWSEVDVMDIPFKRLWQYLKIIKRRSEPGCILFNPSDRVRGEWLKAQTSN